MLVLPDVNLRMPRTFWLLKVAMTLSAPSLVANVSSTMTVGDAVNILQPSVSPPWGARTASISEAVVPGAKLLAMTVKGPVLATPRMLKPGALSLRPFVLLFSTGTNLSYVRLLRSICEAEAVRPSFAVLAARPLGLLTLCRSCCHFPSMFPAGFADDDRPFWTPAPPLIRLSSVGFSEVCRDFAPEPGVPGRPREPRNCWARFSCFFFSRESFTKLAKSAMVVKGDNGGFRMNGSYCVVLFARTSSLTSEQRVSGRLGKSDAHGSRRSRRRLPALAAFFPHKNFELRTSSAPHHSYEVSRAPPPSFPLYHEEHTCRPYLTCNMVIRPLKPNEMTELFNLFGNCFEDAHGKLSLTFPSCL